MLPRCNPIRLLQYYCAHSILLGGTSLFNLFLINAPIKAVFIHQRHVTFGAVKSYTHIFSQLERSDQSNQRLHSSTLLRLQLAREAATRAPRAMAQIPQFDTLLPFSSPLQYFVQLAVNFSLFFRFTFLPAGRPEATLPPSSCGRRIVWGEIGGGSQWSSGHRLGRTCKRNIKAEDKKEDKKF